MYISNYIHSLKSVNADKNKNNCGAPRSSTKMLTSWRCSAIRNSKKDSFIADDNRWGLSLLIYVIHEDYVALQPPK